MRDRLPGGRLIPSLGEDHTHGLAPLRTGLTSDARPVAAERQRAATAQDEPNLSEESARRYHRTAWNSLGYQAESGEGCHDLPSAWTCG